MALRLSNGSRVCIIGGGPAGSLAALHLLDQANQHGLRLEVLIFEPRDFTRPGPGGCNRCAGILSSRLLHGLEDLGLALPREVVQAEVEAYSVHMDGEVLRIGRPDPKRRIVSVYRGAGPRLLRGEPEASFDAYLLSEACARGAQHVPRRVQQVTQDEMPVVRTAQETLPADMVVLASGVNSRHPFTSEFGYRPPQTEIMAQDEILRPSGWPDDQVSIYLRQPPGLMFGAMIPKGQYLNISLLGRRLTRDSAQEFLEVQAAQGRLPEGNLSLCGCTPRIAVGPAPRAYGRRWVAVGDAAVTRLYKDGIGSAFFTAQRAMRTAVEEGVSSLAFGQGYAPLCRRVSRDNLYGRFLFRLWSSTLNRPSLLRAWMSTLQQEATWPPEQRIQHRILWGMLTGDELYRDLFWLSLHPKTFAGLIRAWRGPRR